MLPQPSTSGWLNDTQVEGRVVSQENGSAPPSSLPYSRRYDDEMKERLNMSAFRAGPRTLEEQGRVQGSVSDGVPKGHRPETYMDIVLQKPNIRMVDRPDQIPRQDSSTRPTK